MRYFLFLLFPCIAFSAERDDLLIADFESDTYGNWKTTGTAFGTGPAKGTLPNQMAVSGYMGKGLVNSFNGGDDAKGTLASPEIKLERKYLNFLLGGGKHEGKTCINLLVNGKVVRTATGPNGAAGGSERLDWHSWDVAAFEGKLATLQIVDDQTGGWGHINVDHIVQSDKMKSSVDKAREMTVEKRYLHLPVKNGAPKKRMTFKVDGKIVREFEIELAEESPDFLVFADVSMFKGKKLTVNTKLMSDSTALDAITASDSIPGRDSLYQEKLRPQFHFTSRRGWLNDPNGMVFDGKEWHLFYQHNPYGKEWGNMHWGHASSPDLVHWKELPIGLYPKAFGDWAFSGSAVMDKDNTSGWGSKEDPAMVLSYTSTGRGECMAFSKDKGLTWTEYEKNPVVKHAGRDPKIIWYAPGKHWVMAVYDEAGGKQRIAFHTSPNLKTWTFQSAIDGFYECPDLFELDLFDQKKGEKPIKKWILYGADGKYIVGTFDGKRFTKESGKHQLWHGNFYAAQTFDNAPDGRRVQIGWARGVTFPGMPFNQQMAAPVDLYLRQTKDGFRMFASLPDEFEKLQGERQTSKGEIVLGKTPVVLVDQFDLGKFRVGFEKVGKATIHLRVRGLEMTYDGAKETLTCGKVVAPLKPDSAGRIDLTMLVDRGSIEIFSHSGETAISVAHIAGEKNISAWTNGAKVDILELRWYHMKSAWK